MAGYKIPKPMQQESRWFRFFTPKQVFTVLTPIVVTVIVLFTMVVNEASYISIFLVSLIMISIVFICVILSFFSMPSDKYLWGGGTRVNVLVRRLIRRRLKGCRVLWVKNYGDFKPISEKEHPIKKLMSKVIKFDN